MPVSFSIADSSAGPRKVVIWVTGDLDAESGRAVRARLAQAQRHEQFEVVLDMTSVTSIDSGAVTSIVSGAKLINGAGKLRVISPPERVAQVFADTSLPDLFELVPDRRGSERRERRQRDVPVAVDRRKGDRRAPLLAPVAEHA